MTTSTLKPQAQKVLKTLRSGKTLTSAQARTYGVLNLRARIAEIREAGVRVRSTFVTNREGNRVAKYSVSR